MSTALAGLAQEWQAQEWTADEERTIAAIQQAEHVDRLEAIRRMQRRKRRGAAFVTPAPAHAERFCRNPNCTRGEHGQPAGIDHLRANARFCSDACKKQAQRSPNRQKPARTRQCLCGVKRDKIASRAYPLGSEAQAL